MKRTVLTLLLTFTAIAPAAFSQEIVGSVNLQLPDIKVVIDYYDGYIDYIKILEILAVQIRDSNAESYMLIYDNEEMDTLLEEAYKRTTYVDWDNIEGTWGSSDLALSFTILYDFSYQGKDYFIFETAPDYSCWIFEKQYEKLLEH